MKTNLKIAIQKSGRLQEDSLLLLKECGISIDNGRDQLKAKAVNFPAEVLFLRNSDIPQYLEDGIVDCAIIGENTLIEEQSTATIVEKLGFSKCRLSIAVPKASKVSCLADLNGMRIATSYTNTLSIFMTKANIEAKTHHISGSVEIAPNIGLADAICDLVSSGSTLFKNNLKEVEVLLKSEAVMAKSPVITSEADQILDTLMFRVQSVLKARNSRYVLMNVPNDKIDNIVKILPGMRSPTVLPLAEQGWSSIHTVISKGSFWEVIDALKAEGAEGILVVPIEKMVL